jgi:hypothetical protein
MDALRSRSPHEAGSSVSRRIPQAVMHSPDPVALPAITPLEGA